MPGSSGCLSLPLPPCLALVIAVNEAFRVIVANRIRYIMPLWPMTALLVGAGLWRLANRHRILATGMLALWLISGAGLTVATDYRYGLGYFFRMDPNYVHEILYGHVATTDLLLVIIRLANSSVAGFTPQIWASPGNSYTDTRRIPMSRAGRFTPITHTCGCSTSRRTAWALQICRRRWDAPSANVSWTTGASPWNAMPCIPWRTARTDQFAWRSTPASS